MHLEENIPLARLTTFRIGGPARFFTEAHTEQDVQQAVCWAHEQNLPLFILGGGSNLLVSDAGFAGLVLHIAIPGIEDLDEGRFRVGAGVVWDAFVDHAIAARCAGIECLAGIPGSVGGTPVQNVGAYGQEVSETISSVRAFDREANTFVDLASAGCNFRYRESRFNTDEPNRYIVTAVTFALKPNAAPTLRYADLQRYFASAGHVPTLAETAAAVREIRRGKGMLQVEGDPDTRSAGSFFKNPIVEPAALTRIASTLHVSPESIPNWPAGEGRIKLPAAWLLEKSGFTKGFGEGPVGISSRHTLALINRGYATCADVENFQQQITAKVFSTFGIALTREPVRLG